MDFTFNIHRQNGVVIGKWSTNGCTRNQQLSSSMATVCECTHLTHFGILLSAKPVPVDKVNSLALRIIGYVGVAVSLVAMGAAAFIFIVFKYVTYRYPLFVHAFIFFPGLYTL